jgi:hypothetical protein
MIATEPSQQTEFGRILTDFKSSLAEEHKNDFEFSSLEDLQTAIDDIQKKQASDKKMRNLTRLRPYLEAMAQYGKVIEVFLNASNFVAFVWVHLSFIFLNIVIQILICR